MRFAIVTIGPDGTTAVVGPYSSEYRARMDADLLEARDPGLSADIYEMEPPNLVRQAGKEQR